MDIQAVVLSYAKQLAAEAEYTSVNNSGKLNADLSLIIAGAGLQGTV